MPLKECIKLLDHVSQLLSETADVHLHFTQVFFVKGVPLICVISIWQLIVKGVNVDADLILGLLKLSVELPWSQLTIDVVGWSSLSLPPKDFESLHEWFVAYQPAQGDAHEREEDQPKEDKVDQLIWDCASLGDGQNV